MTSVEAVPGTLAPLAAEVPFVANKKRPERLVIVTDPAVGLVPVWWNLGRSSVWRCSVHGRQRSPECAHVQAAIGALVLELFGGGLADVVAGP